MALAFGGHGLTITSQAFPPSLARIEGGDLLNLTFHLDYNRTKDASIENSTACHLLKNSSVFINLVITLPIVFDIMSPTNQSNHTGSIISNVSNCSFVPSLDISSSFVTNHMQGFKVLNFDIFSQNVSWTATLNVKIKLFHSAKADSLLNITANVTISNETSKVNIATYRTPVPDKLQLEAKSTSIPETPGVTLTSDEEITFYASFQLPRITANVKLQVMLPVFRNSTPMKFVSGSVVALSEGVKSNLLYKGSGPQLSVSPSTFHLFPLTKNVAEFAFGDTVNMANKSFNGTITVKVTAVVDSSQGVYVPDSDGNATCVLMYDSPRGLNMRADETFLTLKLGQPLLDYNLEMKDSDCCYEGRDMVKIEFEVRNPHFSTAPALNFTLDISVPSADIEIRSLFAQLCSNISVSNATGNQSVTSSEVVCTDLNGTHMLTNSSTGLKVELTR